MAEVLSERTHFWEHINFIVLGWQRSFLAYWFSTFWARCESQLMAVLANADHFAMVWGPLAELKLESPFRMLSWRQFFKCRMWQKAEIWVSLSNTSENVALACTSLDQIPESRRPKIPKASQLGSRSWWTPETKVLSWEDTSLDENHPNLSQLRARFSVTFTLQLFCHLHHKLFGELNEFSSPVHL